MSRRRQAGSALVTAALTFLIPMLAGLERVEAGPPDEPRVITSMAEVGRPGGELHTLVGRARDVRLLQVYGYARLVEYDKELKLVPDILASYDVQDGRIFTFKLRRGHKWSDGQPLTAEDFRFWWEDIAQNRQLQPTGPDIQMLIDGERPKFEVLDDLTIRYTWSKPNPFFLPALAATSQLFIYRPAHYLKQFHQKYQEQKKLTQLVASTHSRDWVQLFLRKDRLEKFDNPDEPTLEPWMLTTRPPADRFVAVRNPYFHRVDGKGQQLPYIDRFVLEVVQPKLVPIKAGAGETDLQARDLAFKDYTFLKQSERRSRLQARLWREARSAHLALYPNLNANDPEWRKLFRDRRFRLALSLSVDRQAINQFLYYGLAKPANNTITPDSPLWSDAVGTACLGHDPARANRLLDELGLAKRNDEGTRLLPSGRPLELVVETAGEDTEQSDVMELVRDAWKGIGFKVHTKPSDREVLDNRVFSGEALMSISYGIDNGVPTASTPPTDFAPVNQSNQLQWPKWGQYFETKGAAGEPPDLAAAERLMELFKTWTGTTNEGEQRKVWKEILETYAPECWTIGLVRGVLQPVAVRDTLHNVPKEALYSWEPQGQLGLYLPDTFWFDK